MEAAKLESKREHAVLAAFKQAKKDRQLIPFIAFVFSIYYLKDDSNTSLVKPKSIAQLMENIDILREHFPPKKKSLNKSIPAIMPGGIMPLDNGRISSVHTMLFLKDFCSAFSKLSCQVE